MRKKSLSNQPIVHKYINVVKHIGKIVLLLFAVFESSAISAQTKDVAAKGSNKSYDFIGKYGDNKYCKEWALVSLNGKYGFIDKNGNEVIPLNFDNFFCGRASLEYAFWPKYAYYMSACKNSKWGYIDVYGNIAIPFVYDEVDEGASKNDSLIRVVKNGKYGCIDAKGRTTIPIEYEYIYGFYNNQPSVAKKNGKYGFIDEKNNIVIPFIYTTSTGFGLDANLASVSINGKYGYVDKQGREVIPLQYNFADCFKKGLAAVVKNNKVGFINESGKIVIPFQYDVVWSSKGSYGALLNSSFWWGAAAVKKGKWGVIDRDGKTIVPFIYDNVGTTSSGGYIDLTKDNKKHYFDKGGNEYASESERKEQSTLRLAHQGFPDCQFFIGKNYYKGLNGYPKDYSKAYEWLSKGALGGDREAQFYLGWLYEHGQGIPTNIEEAKFWYSKSAALGEKRAKDQLSKLGGNINPNPMPINKIASLSWLAYNPITEQKDYSFKIGIKSDSKIEDVSVYVNGTLTRGIIPVHNDGYNMTIDRTVALNDGPNTITVMVKNAGGTATTEKTVIYQNQSIATIDWLAFSPTTAEKQFALKAGINSSSKIESWTVSVNGIVDRGINPVKNDGYTLIIDKILTLSEGSNTIKIEVRNAGGIAMAEKSVTCSPKKVVPFVQQKRIALVMGNANYRDIDKRLKNPVNDASDVAAKLEGLGFTVIRSLDQTQQGMETAITNFGNQARNYDVALFYYAGHGVRCNGSNYLIPIDANLPEESYVQYKCTNANLVLDLMDKAHCQMKIVILDACRNNPFARSWNRSTDGGGLNIMNAPKGTFIAFSTAPGEVALDGAERNSPYTDALLQTLDVPNLSITDFFQEVLEKVASKTNDRQTPWTSNSFRGKFIFNQK